MRIKISFLSAQTVYYLLNFNLAPRQIWITRHGESVDNVNGRIGGDSDLSDRGIAYAKALTRFIKYQRQAWDVHQREKARSTHFPLCQAIPLLRTRRTTMVVLTTANPPKVSAYGRQCSNGVSKQPNSLTKMITIRSNLRCLTNSMLELWKD